jgi:hypothetical protein
MTRKNRTSFELEEILMSITDDHASDSEFGGDSDADDDLPIPAIRAKDTPQPGCISNQPMEEDLDSDDSVADPDYLDPTNSYKNQHHLS